MRCFPAVIVAMATLTLWVSVSTSVAAQVTATPNTLATPPAPPVAPVRLSDNAAEILKLARAKISDDVTVAFIQSGSRRFSLTADEIVYLRKQGVSDRVLTAMLNQQSQPAVTAQPPSQSTAPESGFSASAPQYVTPPAADAVADTALASTLYVVPGEPVYRYYSFYDPWPCWYDPWPYWCPYPFFTFGFYWGWSDWGCNYHHRYCHDRGHRPPPHHGDGPPPDGSRPPHDGNPPRRGGNSGPGSRSDTLAAAGRSPAGLDPTDSGVGANSGVGRNAAMAQSARPSSFASNGGKTPAPTRDSGARASTAAARSSQAAGPTSTWGRGANTQASVPSRTGSASAPQFVRTGNSSTPTRVWSGNAPQPTTSRAASVGSSSRVSAAPTPVSNRSGSQSAYRYSARPTASYQHGSYSPGYSSQRGGGSTASFSRSSASSFGATRSASSFRSMGSPSSFRSAGGFSGGGASRMSSGSSFGRGGGFRGGGGGRRR